MPESSPELLPSPKTAARARPSRAAKAPERLPDPRLIREALGYVPSVARRYLGHGLDLDELVAAGNLGLVQAALRYDPSRKVKFITYASWWVRKAVVEAMEALSAPVRLPRYQYEKLRRLQVARQGWIARFSAEPTIEQLSMATGLPTADVERLLAGGPSGTSLDERLGAEGDRQLKDVLEDARIESPQGRLMRRDLTARLIRQVAELERSELRVVLLRFGLGGEPAMTLREAGRRLGLSRERVRQIELQALVKLRASF